MVFTKEYFLEKFNKLADNEVGEGIRRSCALRHCGATLQNYSNPETIALRDLMRKGLKNLEVPVPNALEHGFNEVWEINDSFSGEFDYLGKTPRQRILKVLKAV